MTVGLVLDLIFTGRWVDVVYVPLLLAGWLGVLVAVFALFLREFSTRVKFVGTVVTMILAGMMWIAPFVVALVCYGIYVAFYE